MALTRLSSSTSARPLDFTSYFFHNEQWSADAMRPETHHPPSSPPALVPSSSHPYPSLPLTAYKPLPPLTLPRLLNLYVQLSKSRLSVLVVLTAMSGVALSPAPVSVPVLLATALGTALCSSSANAFNQLQEIPFDAQMARTRSRPLIRRALSPLHVAAFASLTGAAGPALLWAVVNPTTAVLGAANIALYAGAYTYMKRRTIWNTWVGAVVGAIPPLMGWAACGGALLPSSEALHTVSTALLSGGAPGDVLASIAAAADGLALAPLALGLFHFAWQFPHFNSLSYVVRGAYARGGYYMLSVLDPRRNAATALRHALLLTGVCSVLVPLSGLTTWAFALTSLVPNAVFVQASWRFWKQGGEHHARRLFHHSLWYLPVVMGLMMVHKKGMDWGKWLGLVNEEEEVAA